MPESPEVQALAEFLADHATGRALREADVLEFRAVKTRTAPPSSLVGRRVTGVERHGKHLAVGFGEDSRLVVSLGRHGWMRWRGPDDDGSLGEDAPPALAQLTLDDATVEVTDAGTWVSLGLFVVDDPVAVPAIAKLGPDPADESFSAADFEAAVGGRRKQIKAILQEQESLAGIGNAYSDEILHIARVSPVTHGAALDDAARERLFRATVETIRGAIAARRGVPIHALKAAKVDAMRVHGRAGESCPVCGDTIRDLAFGGTTAQYCPTCQNDGVPL
ncbi:Fpg/Nei family DNA glycosylase [Microbacterium sp. NPDC057407]|uniref:Fpg/Nei family DNA glycosylase n=1 Tax=Microbacterium sp. NPDC057407 TaxID=3346120 RepID=UPI00366B6DFD